MNLIVSQETQPRAIALVLALMLGGAGDADVGQAPPLVVTRPPPNRHIKLAYPD